ncbi:MAG: ABC transporter substrate-binding protein [Gemmobacter sp.]|uniref:heme/hemin ABC transporter substrate-binding protein n=1 Tax=Gemmobacter sp. TaxID=1898957 RepID=UPI001A39A5BE|nr:ABC transporter substrate-binding protein [Gemmobacter sp.]MBL8561867.1 ABC transporter substrate-binding protein [Gemmobacter sp.]
MIRLALAVALSVAPVIAAPAMAEPSRIVVLGGTAAEIVAALGAQDRLVARDSTSTFPESLTALPDLGYLRALSPEGVLSAAPDLILAEAGAGPAEAVEVLKAAGLPYVTVPEGYAPEAVAAKISVIGAALGAETAAAALAGQVEAGLAEARAKAAPISPKKRVLFILSLQGGKVMAGGEGSAAEAIIALAGGVNAATGFQGYKPMTEEAVLAAAPDAILMMDRSGRGAVIPEEVMALPALAASPAVQSGAVIRMDGLKLLGFGPRTPEAAAELRAALYGA